MILVDPADIVSRAHPAPDILADSVLRIDDEIKRILNRTDMIDSDKVLAYQHALHQYTSKIKQVNARMPTTNPPVYLPDRDKSVLPEQTIKLEKRVINSLPKTLQEKGKVLLEHMKETTDLTWNAKGEITHDGVIIKNSNISDLVNETVRARKLGSEPAGWLTFAKVLKDSNVPNDLIGNKARWDTFKESGSITSTPVKVCSEDFKDNCLRPSQSLSEPKKKVRKNWMHYGKRR